MQTLHCQEQQHMAPDKFFFSTFALLGQVMLALICASKQIARLVRKGTKAVMQHRAVKKHFMHQMSLRIKTALF